MTADRHLAELCREHDQLRAEHREWEQRQQAAGSPYMRKAHERDDLLYRETDNASLPAPAPVFGASCEEEVFDAAQLDALATIYNELRAELLYDIERVQQQLLRTMVRMVLPGERAEETFYALRDRVARMERQLERQLSQAIVELKTKSDVVDLPNWRKHNAA